MRKRSDNNTRAAYDTLERWGCTPDILQGLGAFAILWGKFESSLESAIWRMKNEEVSGKTPFTEALGASGLIKALEDSCSILSELSRSKVNSAFDAARDLMNYRHAVMHGYLMPQGSMPTFIRNPLWSEIVRGKKNKETHDAHVSVLLLDIVIDCLYTLCKLVHILRFHKRLDDLELAIEKMSSDIHRCRSQANEVRHLTALMNEEKY